MTTPITSTSTIPQLKSQFLPKSHHFPQKDVQDLIDSETHAQLTAPRQRTLTTDIISRAELEENAQGINAIRNRLHDTYTKTQLNPCVSLEESIWRYICKEYPVVENSSDDAAAAAPFEKLSAEEQRQKVYCEIMNLDKFTGVSPVEFDFVRSGAEYARMMQRQLPRTDIDARTKTLVQKICDSKNIPNAVHAMVQFIEAESMDDNKLTTEDHRLWLQVDLDTPAMWNRDVLLENAPHPLFNTSACRIAVICKDDNVKRHVQEEIIYDQAFAYQFLTLLEVRRNFTKPDRFRSLVQSYDIVLVDDESMETFRMLKLAEHYNLFSIDFSKGREEYERIMKGLPFRVLDCKERLRVDIGFQNWDESQLVENCRFAVQQLAHHAPWGFHNVKCIQLWSGAATPLLTIYRKVRKFERTNRLFSKSKGIVSELMLNLPYMRYAPKNLQELSEETKDPMYDLIAQETKKQQAMEVDEDDDEEEAAAPVKVSKPKQQKKAAAPGNGKKTNMTASKKKRKRDTDATKSASKDSKSKRRKSSAK